MHEAIDVVVDESADNATYNSSYNTGAQVGTVFIRISIPDLKVQVSLQLFHDPSEYPSQISQFISVDSFFMIIQVIDLLLFIIDLKVQIEVIVSL